MASRWGKRFNTKLLNLTFKSTSIRSTRSESKGNHSTPAVWPFGTDGALLINGTTVSLPAGSVKDYSSIVIINGGLLEFLPGNAWNIVGCHGNFTLDSTSSIQGVVGTTNGTFTATAPDGTSLSYTTADRKGGYGGTSGDGFYGAEGADLGGGGGGAGASDQSGENPHIGPFGQDGTGGQQASGSLPPGLGGASYGDNGTDGPAANNGEFDFSDAEGSGAGSGSRGYHGQGIYIKIAGSILDGTGAITVSGQSGGNGGNGGDGNCIEQGASGGGGGGGGAGADGGKIVIRKKSGTLSNVTADAGTPGGGGSGGAASSVSGGAQDGNAGTNGEAGIAGTIDIANY